MNIKNQLVKIMFATVLAFVSFSCSDEEKVTIAKLPTITDILKADGNYSVLVSALAKTQITNFTGGGSFTLFAPDNAALASVGITEASLAIATPAQIATWKLILQNHILGVGTIMSDLLPAFDASGFAISTGYSSTAAVGANGALSIFVNKIGETVLVNGGNALAGGANVVRQDVDASNGVVHFVDRVILLPKIVNHVIANPDLSTLKTVVTSTGVVSATNPYGDQSAILTALNAAGPVTVFAPTNTAFTAATATPGVFFGGAIASNAVNAANTTKLLQYHVVNTNRRAASAAAWSTSMDATLTSLAPTAQTFFIKKGTTQITELPAIVAPAIIPAASNIKIVNIQATNGVIHVVDRVLQPVF